MNKEIILGIFFVSAGLQASEQAPQEVVVSYYDDIGGKSLELVCCPLARSVYKESGSICGSKDNEEVSSDLCIRVVRGPLTCISIGAIAAYEIFGTPFRIAHGWFFPQYSRALVQKKY